jgi:hypothetical protein
VDPDGQAAESVTDFISLGISVGMFAQDPSLANALGVLGDAIGTAVPFLPAGAGIIRSGLKAADEVGDAAKVAKGRTFERVVSEAELTATQETGLLRGGRPGENFFTNSASLNAKRAQQRLGLDGPLRDYRVRFQIKNDVTVTGPGPAKPGQSGTPGGGLEFSTSERTEIEVTRIDPLRK